MLGSLAVLGLRSLGVGGEVECIGPVFAVCCVDPPKIIVVDRYFFGIIKVWYLVLFNQ